MRQILKPLLIVLYGLSLGAELCSQAFAEANSYPFSVESIRVGNSYQIVAHNSGHAPVTVVVAIKDVQNVASLSSWPVVGVVQPYGEKLLGTVTALDPRLGYRFKTNISYLLGDLNARIDPNQLYRLPYLEGKTFAIAQAPGGPITTHNTPGSRNAVDIAMPEGTSVLAAREGIVIEAKDGYTDGGKDPRLMSQANDIRLLHGDGTIASYAHLMPHGSNVRIGQRVSAGEVIGFSGSTGYSSGPHLHFAVTRIAETKGVLSEISVPIRFYVGNPVVAFAPRSGLRVTANYLSAVDPQRLDRTVASTMVADVNKLDATNIGGSSSVVFMFIQNNWSWISVLMLIFMVLGLWNWLEARASKQEALLEELRKTWRP